MRKVFWLGLQLGLAAGGLSAGTIHFDVTPLGGNSYQYNYQVIGITFQANEELDIKFDQSLYINLSAGVAPAAYSLNLFQPILPTGPSGDYSAIAQIDNPSTAGPFSVQFTFTGAGLPDLQPYFLNQYDNEGNFVSTLAAGFTTNLAVTSATPEPASLALTGATLLLGGLWMIRRRLQKTGSR